ncbi:Aim4p TDEL_0B02960 [Torulaspora delbrueckii]|uniref:Uncharacterized protein n=1 Tax=Torulaspora delbrueckii TaxID=4950 RepID=G8ZP81_TORDE|nr:hypothetical protein TDEL_0B02960 [Torulaspora delbrueckii]CCE90425.1 hypothetical protein TDEL_0B02960 [Torulaspora delbrueckii]
MEQEPQGLGEEEKSRANELGAKSIFYDPDWNRTGEAPPGFKNIPYNPATFTRKNETIERHLAGLGNIPRPTT